MITELVNELINYGIDTGLVNSEDEIYVRNSILSILETNEYDESIDKKEGHRELHEILEDILTYAIDKKLVDDNIVARDLFDTKIMGAMVMPPSIINAKFWDKYKESSVEATNFYYDFSRNTNYGDFSAVETKGNLKYPKSILTFSKPHPSISIHPTQKPVELLEWLIKTYTNEGETVLDNCMGSGSTGVACVNTNRKFKGIELDKDYFIIAKDRINKTIDNK